MLERPLCLQPASQGICFLPAQLLMGAMILGERFPSLGLSVPGRGGVRPSRLPMMEFPVDRKGGVSNMPLLANHSLCICALCLFYLPLG